MFLTPFDDPRGRAGGAFPRTACPWCRDLRAPWKGIAPVAAPAGAVTPTGAEWVAWLTDQIQAHVP